MNGKSLFKERVGKKFSSTHFFLNTLLFCLTAQSMCLAQGNYTIDSHPDVIRARNFSERALFDSSIFYYQKSALDFYRREEWQAYVYCKAKAGAYGNYLGTEFKINALKDLNQALSIYNQHSLPDDEVIGDLLFYYGQHYHFFYPATGWKEALNFYKKSLDVRLDVLKHPHEKIAECYLGMGDINNYILLDFADAEAYYQKALLILEGLPPGDYFNLVTVYYDLAATNKKEQDLDKALLYAQRCLYLIDNSLEIRKEEFKALILTVLSNIYSEKKEYQKAISYLKEALLINQLHNDLYRRVIYLNNLAENYLYINNHYEARICVKKAILIEEQNNFGNSDLLARSLSILSKIHNEIGDVELARDILLDAISLMVRKHNRNNAFTAELYYDLGKLYKQNGDLDSALRNFQRAIYATIANDSLQNDFKNNPRLDEVGSDYLLFEILTDKARILELLYNKQNDQGYLQASLNSYLTADSLFSNYRSGLDNQNARMIASEKFGTLYNGLMATAWENWINMDDDNSRQLIVDVIEKNKMRMLQDALAEAVGRNSLGIPDSLVSANRNFNIQLAYYQQLRTSVELSPEQEDQVQEEIFQLTRVQEKRAAFIRDRYPDFARIKFGETALTYNDIRDWTKRKKALLIDFFWSDEFLFVCGIYGNYFKCLKIEADSINTVLLRFVSFIKEGKGANKESFFVDGHYLYQTLFAPFLSLPVSNIVIIPDGRLYHLPVEALPRNANGPNNFKNAEYMLKHYTITYAYNLYSVVFPRIDNNNRQRVLGFSFSYNPGNDFSDKRNAYEELQGSAIELDAIKALFAGVYYQGEDATESNFKKLANEFEIIHLAVHGKIEESFQNQISLLFRTEADSINDGKLYPYEIYGLHLKARMAVLSACSSGIGHIYKGEGIVSLASAFSYAGCPTVALSLWDVSDSQTAIIMKSFYRKIKKGKAIDMALKESKLEYINDNDEYSAHPRYWAAFIIMGATEPINSDEWPTYLFISFGLFFLVIAIIVYLKTRGLPLAILKQGRLRSP